MRYRMTKVSVIVAVYNMEKHLRQCVESVLNQTLANVEVVCVDDVSTDGSLELLRQLAQEDSRVKVLEQEVNGGAQLARNAGILASSGEFITVLDDDDWLAPDALELAVKEFDGRDDVECVILKELRVRPDGSIFEPEGRWPFREASGEEVFYHSMPWHVSGRYLVRRPLQLRILYDNADRVYGEDNTALLHFLESPSIIQSQGIYYYRLLDDSLSHAMNMAIFEGLKSHVAMSGHLLNGGYSHSVRCAHERFRWLMVVNAIRHLYLYGKRYYSEAQRREAWQLIRDDYDQMNWELVPADLMHKFGYMPIRCSWTLFRFQEWAYFTLKKLTGRI